MAKSLNLNKYSLGIGDRFGRQAQAQLRACVMAAEAGVEVIPVWNKSNREHLIIGSEPASSRAAADAAVKALGWKKPYHVDADHITLNTVGRFIPHSDFYTIDVADWIGKPASAKAVGTFVTRHSELVGGLSVAGVEQPLHHSARDLEAIAGKYLLAVQEAAKVYRQIVQAKGEGNFITEVSLDEATEPQTPADLLVILAALADEKVPLQTVAPKFTGRFNKGVDYAGDVAQFAKQFNEDLAVIAFAVKQYGLPARLKISIHSGSDKFSIYGAVRRGLATFKAGLHLKTAGTTWLEEVIGLAEANTRGLALAKEVYAGALTRIDELCGPYATVLDIDRRRLPSAKVVGQWSSGQFVSALRHDVRNPAYNPHLRQLMHVGYKVAAEMGNRYLEMLDACAPCVSKNVTENLYARHLKPIFLER